MAPRDGIRVWVGEPSELRYSWAMELKVLLEQGEDGYFVAHSPSLKSCWSQGRTREEALQNLREAIELPAPTPVKKPIWSDAFRAPASLSRGPGWWNIAADAANAQGCPLSRTGSSSR